MNSFVTLECGLNVITIQYLFGGLAVRHNSIANSTYHLPLGLPGSSRRHHYVLHIGVHTLRLIPGASALLIAGTVDDYCDSRSHRRVMSESR